MPGIKKVAIYCRLSEEDRNKLHSTDDSESIKNQKAMLSQYALSQDWQIYQVYSDDDYTGSDRNRPAFNQLLADAEAGKFDIILCKTQSRFTRELEMVEKYIHYLFPLWGIRFVSIVDNADTDIKGNKKSRQINGLINEWYLEDMSENIKAVLTNRRRNGFFIGAFAPYGYKKDENLKGHLVIDEPAAAVVRRIFDLYLAGHGRTAIARILNADNIASPMMYKLENGEKYTNKYKGEAIWRYYSIGRILTDEVYIGNLIQNKAHSISYKTKIIKPTRKEEWIRVENTHEPIISKEKWYTAQEILADRRNHSSPNAFLPQPYAFRHKLVCGCCQAYLKRGKTATGVYYRCGTTYYDKSRCEHPARISDMRITEAVTNEIQKLFDESLNKAEVAETVHLADNTTKKIAALKDQIKTCEEQLASCKDYLKTLYIDKVKGVVDAATYQELSAQFTHDSEKYANRITAYRDQIDVIEQKQVEHQQIADIVQKHLGNTALNRELVDTLIDKIVVNYTVPYSREVDIEIYWNI